MNQTPIPQPQPEPKPADPAPCFSDDVKLGEHLWAAPWASQDGKPPSSAKALLITMGPFLPDKDGFPFVNSFGLTAANAVELTRMFRDEVIEAATPGIVRRYTSLLSNLSFEVPVPIFPDPTVGRRGVRILCHALCGSRRAQCRVSRCPKRRSREHQPVRGRKELAAATSPRLIGR